jgi:hypothetical protein
MDLLLISAGDGNGLSRSKSSSEVLKYRSVAQGIALRKYVGKKLFRRSSSLPDFKEESSPLAFFEKEVPASQEVHPDGLVGSQMAKSDYLVATSQVAG